MGGIISTISSDMLAGAIGGEVALLHAGVDALSIASTAIAMSDLVFRFVFHVSNSRQRLELNFYKTSLIWLQVFVVCVRLQGPWHETDTHWLMQQTVGVAVMAIWTFKDWCL